MSEQPETQFDFWLGEWDCAWGEDGKGSNRIERILDGKVIQENFDGSDFLGISVSVWDSHRKLWCQTWVDNSGAYLDFTGSLPVSPITHPFWVWLPIHIWVPRDTACRQAPRKF